MNETWAGVTSALGHQGFSQASATMRVAAAAALLAAASASNPFTSTIVPLTSKNIKELESSPFLWMVNICRQG